MMIRDRLLKAATEALSTAHKAEAVTSSYVRSAERASLAASLDDDQLTRMYLLRVSATLCQA